MRANGTNLLTGRVCSVPRRPVASATGQTGSNDPARRARQRSRIAACQGLAEAAPNRPCALAVVGNNRTPLRHLVGGSRRRMLKQNRDDSRAAWAAFEAEAL